MRFSIDHHTEYQFSQPVFLEPHQFRFQPRNSGCQRLKRFSIAVEPTPAGLCHYLDAEGNVAASAWFDGLHETLAVRTHCEVETLRENPFDYLLTTENDRLPVEYCPWQADMLHMARKRQHVSARHDPVREWAEQIRDAVDHQVLPFLTRLNETIYERYEVRRRDDGPPWKPDQTLTAQAGACRDLAELFNDACRSVGLAARFVSGYQEGDPDQVDRDLHAWSEVYVPNAGWRGFDPTHGLTVADRHVAVAAAVDPSQAAPVIGSFRGTGALAVLHSKVHIDVSEPVAK